MVRSGGDGYWVAMRLSFSVRSASYTALPTSDEGSGGPYVGGSVPRLPLDRAAHGWPLRFADRLPSQDGVGRRPQVGTGGGDTHVGSGLVETPSVGELAVRV